MGERRWEGGRGWAGREGEGDEVAVQGEALMVKPAAVVRSVACGACRRPLQRRWPAPPALRGGGQRWGWGETEEWRGRTAGAAAVIPPLRSAGRRSSGTESRAAERALHVAPPRLSPPPPRPPPPAPVQCPAVRSSMRRSAPTHWDDAGRTAPSSLPAPAAAHRRPPRSHRRRSRRERGRR